ncbi:hypothetical protein [Roseinatronobacter alkalisoli]|uniref:Uncharacterized protein n=1 Tax=Roseinatronobacter alkalisoli TaxID=3028235 RepID=A0ABT5TDL4_9RHOB|nr:hypothetical protein [Roseinatronobacter sp. HJB301]MDD7973194.1 hypothetical protein [Roseinatronobacter sp. HJB301]
MARPALVDLLHYAAEALTPPPEIDEDALMRALAADPRTNPALMKSEANSDA